MCTGAGAPAIGTAAVGSKQYRSALAECSGSPAVTDACATVVMVSVTAVLVSLSQVVVLFKLAA